MKKRLYYIVVLDIKDDKFYFFDKNQIKELKDLSDIKVSQVEALNIAE